jgi:hypothetical protein
VYPFRSGRLRERLHAETFERVAHEERGLAHRLERSPRNRIKIEVQIVGTIDVVAACVPWVQIDAAEVHDPQQRREILHHGKIDDVARRVLDRARLDPFRTRRRRALHEEALARRAVRIALHHHRTIDEVRQERRCDVGVILQEIALGQAELGPEDLAQIGETHFARTDCDFAVLHGGRYDEALAAGLGALRARASRASRRVTVPRGALAW